MLNSKQLPMYMDGSRAVAIIKDTNNDLLGESGGCRNLERGSTVPKCGYLTTC